MTSRVSFLKLMIETFRRHMTTVLITALVFFIDIITFFLNVQNLLNTRIIEEDYLSLSSSYLPQQTHIAEELATMCAPTIINYVIAVLCGIYFAFDFFRYMHSKKETDFYDSMPIKRQTWFRVLFFCSFSLFTILTLITLGIELAIVYSVGYGSALMCQNIIWNFLCMLGAFLVCWATTALAMIMTGNSIIAFLGFGVFSCYIPLGIGYLFPTYGATFFDTYVFQTLPERYYYFSPVTVSYTAMQHFNEWTLKDNGSYLLGCFILAMIIGIIAYMLFLRRPSETAGRAMAFEKANPVIRFALVIPLTLYAGLLLHEISYYASMAWLVFGIIFGGFLIHGIIECIFHFDIKALFGKKLQLLATIIFCLGFAFVFWADLMHYDDYLPEAKDVKSVKIHTYYFDMDGETKTELQDGLSGEYADVALDAIEDILNSTLDASDDEEYVHMNNFRVTYELKNGMTRKREYRFYGNKFPESLDKLYATEEFKDDYCVLYHPNKINISSVGVNNGPEYFKLDLSETERAELFHIYLSEYTPMTLSQSLNEHSPLQLVVESPAENEDYIHTYRYYIYESCTKTLDFLKEKGVKTFEESDSIKLLNLELYGGKFEDKDERYFISDEKELNALRPYMILNEFYFRDYGGEYLSCDLRYELDGNVRNTSVYIKQEDINKVIAP